MAENSGKTLYLLRHAKAKKSVPGEDDLARPLIRRGREAAGRVAAWFVERQSRPATILCSPAARTRETLEILRPALGRAETSFDARLYGASPATLLGLIAKLPAASASALIIGHNPGIEELALELAGHGPPQPIARMREKFPTGALAVFTALVSDWRGFASASRIADFIRPADLE